MTERTPIVYGGKDGVKCYGAPELPYRLYPPKNITFDVSVDNTGARRSIVVCERAKIGKGNCGVDGPPCIFASFNTPVERETVIVDETYKPLKCSTALGDAVLNERAHKFTIGDQTIPVSFIEQNILNLLMRTRGRAVTTLELWEQGEEFRTKHGHTEEDFIRRRDVVIGNVNKLRKKLGEYGSVIATIPRVGYELRQEHDEKE